jgi:hypothetical protein
MAIPDFFQEFLFKKFQNYKILSMRAFEELQSVQHDTNCSSLPSIKPKLWPFLTFFYEFLRIFIQAIPKFQNFEYEVIWKTPICTKRYQMQLYSSYLAKVMTISNFFYKVFQSFCSRTFQVS